MKYVMSDIHGCYDEFIEMLNKINFSKEDELYILGDILDRGNKPIDILDYVISHKNIYLIKGNSKYGQVHANVTKFVFINELFKVDI